MKRFTEWESNMMMSYVRIALYYQINTITSSHQLPNIAGQHIFDSPQSTQLHKIYNGFFGNWKTDQLTDDGYADTEKYKRTENMTLFACYCFSYNRAHKKLNRILENKD